MALNRDTSSTTKNEQTLWVAIIGAGPAGYYTAEALTGSNENVHVDIIDRLPTPYGLIRAGVAPDHQSIKNVARRYANTNARDSVRFVGNLGLGRDITLAELENLYDVIILATGAPKDRPLDIEGENLTGVYGSGAFVGWYNSHPDFKDLNPDLQVASAAIIGNGNVAVDVARILAKTANEMAQTDIATHASEAITSSNLKDIYLLGRRGPLEAAFTPKELGELNALENCIALVDTAQLPNDDIDKTLSGAQKKNLAALRCMAENKPEDKGVRLHICFYRRPMSIIGNSCACGVRLEETKLENNKAVGTGISEVLPAGLIVSCIGYKGSPLEDIPYDIDRGIFRSKEGKIRDGLYCVGWARRGPTGTIGTNKPDGVGIAAKILSEVQPAGKEGRDGLDALISQRDLHIVTFKDWEKIDTAEIAAAAGGAPRVKFTEIDTMVSIAESE